MYPQFTPQTELDALLRLAEVTTALSIATGAMAWWRKGSEEEDQMVVQANDLVLDALSNADAARAVECLTGQNWRDQVTVEQAMEMDKERKLRGFGFRRN